MRQLACTVMDEPQDARRSRVVRVREEPIAEPFTTAGAADRLAV